MTVVQRTFDRTKDIPKLLGCNTRNMSYRWDVYERHLAAIEKGAEVLDFGAGSLRETYDLAIRGYRVTAADLDVTLMEVYARDFDWSQVQYEQFTSSVSTSGNFRLVTAFDVIEHLQDPARELA